MTHPFTPDITFLPGTPVDSQLCARFEKAQDDSRAHSARLVAPDEGPQ
jgi:hypothetical protein